MSQDPRPNVSRDLELALADERDARQKAETDRNQWEITATNLLARAEKAEAALAEAQKDATKVLHDRTLLQLARRCLWVAYVWNDHKFREPIHITARNEAINCGIKSFDEANDWIVKIDAAIERLRSERDGRKP